MMRENHNNDHKSNYGIKYPLLLDFQVNEQQANFTQIII